MGCITCFVHFFWESELMKFRPVMLSLLATTLMSGCATVNTDTLMQSGAQAYQAYTLSDADVKTLSV